MNKTIKRKIALFIIILIGICISTYCVVNGYYDGIDTSVHNFFASITTPTMTTLMNIFTFLGCTKFMVGLAIVILLISIYLKKSRYGITSVSILIISTIVNNVIKPIVKRPRPEYITVIENTYSFPSGHMMASVTLYGTLIYLINKSNFGSKIKYLLTFLLVLIILLVGASRIYLGAHYFSDVFTAALISSDLIILLDILNTKYGFIK